MWSERSRQIAVDLVAVFVSFVRQPRESIQILRTLPEMVAGSRRANCWVPTPSEEPVNPSAIASQVGANPLVLDFKSHSQGRYIWKYEHYLDIYNRYFARFVGKAVHVVEIGISEGSQQMWRSYFGPNCRVYGIDIREECKVYAGDRIEVFIGDQANREFWKSFKERVPHVDIVIVDGGRRPNQQIVTLEEMVPHLRPGGVYLCEDILGVRNRFPAYMYGWLRRLNSFDWRPSDLVADATPFQREVKAIHLHPHVAVIEKSDVPIEHFRVPMQGTE